MSEFFFKYGNMFSSIKRLSTELDYLSNSKAGCGNNENWLQYNENSWSNFCKKILFLQYFIKFSMIAKFVTWNITYLLLQLFLNGFSCLKHFSKNWLKKQFFVNINLLLLALNIHKYFVYLESFWLVKCLPFWSRSF